MKDFAQWKGFEGSRWKEQTNVRDFIRHNYTPYDGDDSFLEGPTEATDKLWGKLQELQIISLLKNYHSLTVLRQYKHLLTKIKESV